MYLTPAVNESESGLMATGLSNQRSSPRAFIVCPITVEFESGTVHGIVRDFSDTGLFFYSNFRPELQMKVDFVFHVDNRSISGHGKVVRVHEGSPGAAIGVAVKLSVLKIERR